MNEHSRQLRVRVTAGAKKETWEAKGDLIFMSVREPAQDNRANERVRELVAYHLAVPIKSVRIVAGHHKPTKRITILNSTQIHE